MDKRFWAIVGVIVVIFGGVLFINNQHKGSTTTPPTEHIRGNLSSKVTLQEYGDYQCPACGEFYSVTHEVQTKYADKIKFQFSNLPLTSLHPNAFSAARAAEAADKQGKFWQMHDTLYQNQDPSGKSGWVASSDPLNNYFVKYAQQLGLDITKFKADYASQDVNNRINADIDAFQKTGEPMATPSFFLNGKKLNNSNLLGTDNLPSLEAFSKQLDQALASN